MEACGIGIGTSCASEPRPQQLVVTTILIDKSVKIYIYMPLLEETGYMPKHKYSYGPEFRAGIANCRALEVASRTIFRQQVTEMAWNPDKKQWGARTEFVGQTRPRSHSAG